MPNAFTPPSFHEDQPSGLEQSLAGIVAGHSPAGALAMLIPEAQRRSQAQGDYHDYMANINQQQMLNLQNNRQENQIKGLEQLSSHPILGSGRLAQSMGLIPQTPEADAYGQGLNTAASASNIKSVGEGLGPYMTAGGITTPQAMGQFIPHPPGQPAVTGVTDPALVRGASIRSAGEMAVAGMKNDQDKNQVDLPTDANSPLGLSGGKYTLRGTAATDYIKSHGSATPQTPALSPAAKVNALTKLHATDPKGYEDVRAGGMKIVPTNDPNAAGGIGFQGASGRIYH